MVTKDLKKLEQKFVLFLLASLFFHALFLFVLRTDFVREKLALQELPQSIEVELIPTNPPREDKSRQIAETTLVEKSDKAKPDAFLGKQTQVVEKQTKAENVAAFQEGITARMSGATQPQKKSLSGLGVKMDLKPLGHIGPKSTTPGRTASTSDYLKDINGGAETLLNTREFVFFSFYQRVRNQLEQYWEPGLHERLKKMFLQGRRIATNQEHATRLIVVMNREGSIEKIQVEGTSGLVDLDQAAIEAFNKAGPFPNPPKGMLDSSGKIKVEWEFILKT